jgi:cytochrome c oxidase assembly protein subunit 15
VNFVAKLGWGVVLTNLAVVLWGAWVRITGSGAGCGEHWPDCNGAVIPRDASVQTLIEYTHRATSGIAMLLTLWLFVAAWRAYGSGHRVRRAAGIALGFIIVEALLGAGLVLLGLVADNASPARAVVMAIHLLNTLFLLGGMTMCAWWATDTHPIDLQSPRRRSLLIGVGLFFAVGITGAIAALGDTLFPASSLLEGIAADLDPASHFLLNLRTLHPVVALLCAGWLWSLATRWPSRPGRWLKALLAMQVLAGFANLALLAPGWLQLVHLLLADLAWVVFLIFSAVSLRPHTTAPSSG